MVMQNVHITKLYLILKIQYVSLAFYSSKPFCNFSAWFSQVQ